YRCMNANSKQRPRVEELQKVLLFWYHSIYGEIFGNKGKEVKATFKETVEELPNTPISYEKEPNSIHISQEFMFENLPKPVNSPTMNNEGIMHFFVSLMD